MSSRKLLGQARVHTFEYVPYLASYIYGLREEETPGIGTAAVDEQGVLYWDPDFVTVIGRDQAAYLVAHEVLHLIFDHHSRAREIIGPDPGELERFVCNVAGDLVIEQTLHVMRHLRPDGAVHLGCEVPAWNIRLDLPENRSMQEYYRLIMEKLRGTSDRDSSEQRQAGDSNANDEGDGGADDGGDGVDSADGGADDGGGAGGGEGQGTSVNAGFAGSVSAGQGSPPPAVGVPGMGGSCADGCPRPYEIETDGSWQSYGEAEAAAKAAEAIERHESANPGSVPGAVRQAIRGKLRRVPDPFERLQSAVCASMAAAVGERAHSRRRRSRKQPPGDDTPLLHGRVPMQPRAVVIVDTSWSMLTKETQQKALSVIARGLRKVGRIRVYCADTCVQSDQLVATTRSFEWCGGGGTDMSAAIASVDRDDRPDAIVLVTDAETRWRGPKPRAHVVVAYTGAVGSPWHRAIPPWCSVVPLSPGRP